MSRALELIVRNIMIHFPSYESPRGMLRMVEIVIILRGDYNTALVKMKQGAFYGVSMVVSVFYTSCHCGLR